jgi:hypothetical protein
MRKPKYDPIREKVRAILKARLEADGWVIGAERWEILSATLHSYKGAYKVYTRNLNEAEKIRSLEGIAAALLTFLSQPGIKGRPVNRHAMLRR